MRITDHLALCSHKKAKNVICKNCFMELFSRPWDYAMSYLIRGINRKCETWSYRPTYTYYTPLGYPALILISAPPAFTGKHSIPRFFTKPARITGIVPRCRDGSDIVSSGAIPAVYSCPSLRARVFAPCRYEALEITSASEHSPLGNQHGDGRSSRQWHFEVGKDFGTLYSLSIARVF